MMNANERLAAANRKRVLVADDNAVNQKVARLQLQRLGYDAEVVANGAEAISAVTSRPYDLVLMDCQMPEVDGFEATRRLRAMHECRIPIVALTTLSDRDKCLHAGMDDHLRKPVNLADLERTLQRWLSPASA